MPENDRTVIDLVKAETRAYVSGRLDPAWDEGTVTRAAIDLTRGGDAHSGVALLEGFAAR